MTETNRSGVLAKDTPFVVDKAVKSPSLPTKSKASRAKAGKRKTQA